MKVRHRIITSMALLWSSAPIAALAQDAAQGGRDHSADGFDETGEIIVTAQKRSQNINSVPMSITAASGEQLQLAGIKSVQDLGKITPGFSAGKNNVGTEVFTLRGIGYNDTSIAARPAVTVYLDEAPLPFATETAGVGLDVERLEVLKGPQGTLFGNNSTGGAINFIANKPTDHFEAGGIFTHGRFNQRDLEAYVSGPLTDTLGARLAVEHRGMDEWQKNYTRDDKLGKRNFTNGRLTLLWKPASDLRTQLTISRWIDRSDTQATQVIDVSPQIPAFAAQTPIAGIVLTPHTPRAANWNPNLDLSKNNRYFQITGRIDFDISSQFTLTSLTTYNKFRMDQYVSSSGTDFEAVDNRQFGFARTFYQEARLAARLDRLNAILGASFSHDLSSDDLASFFGDSTLSFAFMPFGAPRFASLQGFVRQNGKTYALFGNAEFELTPELTLQGGARYTKADLEGRNCSKDGGDGKTALVVSTFANVVRASAGLPPIDLPPQGACVSLFTPSFEPGLVIQELNEDNISWRAGIQYTPASGSLLYANISKGYKGGVFSSLGTTTNSSYAPARQESVLAYEVGFKLRLLDRLLQLNGASFFYDYRNKQVAGNFDDPFLGTISGLVNIPKARAYGAELQLIATPLSGLTLSGAGTYVKSDVLGHYTDINAEQVIQDFHGTALPFAPQWQLNGSARYVWPLDERVNAFASLSVSYQSVSYSFLGEVDLVRLKPYSLTDIQAGIESAESNWRAYLWGRNIFNSYYATSAQHFLDVTTRTVGMPATYGITVGFNFR